jgi:hypothetical protein
MTQAEMAAARERLDAGDHRWPKGAVKIADDLRKALDALDRLSKLAEKWSALSSDRGAFADNPSGAHESSRLWKCACDVLDAIGGKA